MGMARYNLRGRRKNPHQNIIKLLYNQFIMLHGLSYRKFQHASWTLFSPFSLRKKQTNWTCRVDFETHPHYYLTTPTNAFILF